MFKVYLEPDILEQMILDKHQTPNWYKVLSEHADVYLNLSDADLATEELDNEVFFQFIMANGGKMLNAAAPFFGRVYADNSRVVEKPRSAFFLRGTQEQARAIQSAYGVIIQSADAIDDGVLNMSFFRELAKGDVFEQGAVVGWKLLLNFDLPPSNSVIIADPYLFSNSESVRGVSMSVGERNSIRLLDKLLPDVLSTDYHVTIIAERVNKPDNWHQTLITNLQTSIQALRHGYNIITEVIFLQSEHLHKRRVILNYVNGSCDKGFGVFRIADNKTVRGNNDIRLNHVFAGVIGRFGNTEYDSATMGLQQIKSENQRIRNVVLQNRLINDV